MLLYVLLVVLLYIINNICNADRRVIIIGNVGGIICGGAKL